MHILRCMDSKFCVEFQRASLKFNAKFRAHTTQNMHFTAYQLISLCAIYDIVELLRHKSFEIVPRSPPWYLLKTLKTSLNISCEYQGCRPDDRPVSVYVIAGSPHYNNNLIPADTSRNNDVVITSKLRHFDVITSKWRRFDVITTLLLRHVFSEMFRWSFI